MQQNRSLSFFIVFFAIALYGVSCTKDKTASNTNAFFWSNRLAQDSAFRMGKWYSISDGVGFNFSNSPLLDTIWFLPGSIAGWSHFVPYNPYAFAFRTTFFPDNYHIAYLVHNLADTNKIDTVILQCGMNATQDTFGIYWPEASFKVFLEQYVKRKS